MGLFSALKRSTEKSKKMKVLIDAIDWQGPRYGTTDPQMAFDDFYNYIANDEYLGPILDKHNVSKSEIFEYMERLTALGYGWEGSAYIPVSSFGFPNTLDYVLSAIENDDSIASVAFSLSRMLKL